MKYLAAAMLILTAAAFPFLCGAEELDYSALSGASLETLDNGLTLVTKHAGLPGTLTAQVWIRAGTFHEGKEQNGLSALLSSLLWEDMSNVGVRNFREALSSAKGRCEVNNSKEFIYFSLTVPRDSFPALFPSMMGLIFSPVLEDSSLQEIKRYFIEKINMMDKYQRYRLNKKLYELAYGAYGLSNSLYGDSMSLSSVQLESAADFHGRYFTAGNAAVVITGDFDYAEAKKTVSASALGIKGKGAEEAPLSGYLKAGYPVSLLLKDNFQKSVLSSAYYAPDIGSPGDVLACDLLLYLLGMEGSTFRKQLLYDKKLADEMHAEFQTRKRGDIFRFEFVTSKKNIKMLQAEISSAFASIRAEGFSDTDIKDAKQRLFDSYIFDNMNAEKIAYTAGYYWALGVPDFEKNYIGGIMALKKEEIDGAFNKYFDMPNNVTLILVGDHEK